MPLTEYPNVNARDGHMVTENARYARNLADRISDLKELVPVGVSASQLKAATVWLRDIYQNFGKFWQYVGLSGEPMITAYALEWDPLPADVTALLFGGEELPTYGGAGIAGMVQSIAVGTTDDGRTVEMPSVAQTWSITSRGTDIGGVDPFVERDRTFKDYFSSPVACHGGKTINRFDIIQYAAYRVGYVHAQGDQYVKRSPDAVAILDHIAELDPAYRRPNLEYMLLSICQELLRADALETYRVAATS